MTKKLKILFAVLFLTWTATAQAKAKENSIKDIDAVVIQDDVSIGTHAPSGWVIDSSTAQSTGLCALYVQEKFSFGDSPAIIYARISDKSYSGDGGIERLVNESATMFKGKSPKFKLEVKGDFKNKKDLTFKIRDFLNEPAPNGFETVAYLPFKNHIFFAIYSSKTKEDYEKHKKSFDDFLERVSPYSSDMSAMSGLCLYPKK